MSDVLVTGIMAAFVAVVVALVGAVMNFKIAKLNAMNALQISQQERILEKQEILHLEVDGRLQELLETTRKLANAVGNKEGRAELANEQNNILEPTKVIVVEPAEVVIVGTKTTE